MVDRRISYAKVRIDSRTNRKYVTIPRDDLGFKPGCYVMLVEADLPEKIFELIGDVSGEEK